MAKKDMKKALGASIKAEEDAFRSRFEKAESALTGKRSSAKSKQKGNGTTKVDKVIRDSFTMPATDYESIGRIKLRAMKGGFGTNKSEILRAGLSVLEKMPDGELLKVFEKLPKVKPGRPTTKTAGD